MAAKLNNNNDDVISEINIIPFVDIVLVLLIIFMVTSTAIVRAAIKVDLPNAAAAGSKVDATVNLILTTEEMLFLDGEELSYEKAFDQLKAKAAADPTLQAVISADRKLQYGEVVAIIEMVKNAGVNTFALNIERKNASAAKKNDG